MRIESIDKGSQRLAFVKQMGKEHSSTLGFFPEGAFDEYADKGQILVAVDTDDTTSGYLLYRISNRIARIVHLCVPAAARRNGTARGLVDHLKLITKDLVGISLNCRHDYEANNIWPRFGFVAHGESPGRGKIASSLVYWWFDHGHPTLFDSREDASAAEIVVCIDANVFFDFYDTNRDGYQESNSLRADWLSQSIEVRPTEELFNEIIRSPDPCTRSSSREKAKQFTIISAEAERIESLVRELTPLHPKASETLSSRDRSDLRQIAFALAASAPYFVTRDDVLLRQSFVTSVKERYAITILRPADLVRKIDEIRSETDYQPASLKGTEISQTYVRSGQERDLHRLFSRSEAQNRFSTRIRSCLADVDGTKTSMITNSSGSPLALLAVSDKDPERLTVPVLRINAGRLTRTLAEHLVIDVVTRSIAGGKQAVEICDPFLDAETRVSIHEHGFVKNQDSFVKFHVPEVEAQRTVALSLKRLNPRTPQEVEHLEMLQQVLSRPLLDLPRQHFVDVESLLFPLKISDAPVPSFVIPIQPQWAKELFDSDLAAQGLFPAQFDLALRKEQVYYRSARPSAGITAPARILWYVSKGKSRLQGVGAIRASSRLKQVVVGKPTDLYNRYKRLGIYQWSDVLERADGNPNKEVMALLFDSTERFEHPVSLDELRRISEELRFGFIQLSVSQVPATAFNKIYGIGTKRGK